METHNKHILSSFKSDPLIISLVLVAIASLHFANETASALLFAFKLL